jgi:hypothetical protein
MLRRQTLGHIITISVARILCPTKMTTSHAHAGRRQNATVVWILIGPATIATTADDTAENIPHLLHAGLEPLGRVFRHREFHPLPHGETLRPVQVDEAKVVGTTIH